MARPKLTKRGNTWYRNGKVINPGYKYFDTTKKLWMILGANGVFTPYAIGVRTKGKTPNKDSLALQYARLDLAPSVPFLADNKDLTTTMVPISRTPYDYTGDNAAQKHNKKINLGYYNLVNDSIAKRISSGYYDKYPEQYKRDIKMRDLYKTHSTSPAGWGCINSVEGLYDRVQWSNRDFVENKRYANNYKIIPITIGNATSQYITPGSIILSPYYGHSIMYLGNKDKLGNIETYNTHGLPQPFKNGDQISYTMVADYAGYDNKNPGYIFLK